MVLHFSAASGYIYSISLESSLLAGCVLTLYDSIQLWRKWPLQQLVKGLQDWHQGYDLKVSRRVSKPMSFMCLLGALAACNWLCRRTPNQCGGCLFFVVTSVTVTYLAVVLSLYSSPVVGCKAGETLRNPFATMNLASQEEVGKQWQKGT